MKIAMTLEQWETAKKNPYYYDTSPIELQRPIVEQEALKLSWLNIVKANPDLYKDCPYSFSDLPVKAVIRRVPSEFMDD